MSIIDNILKKVVLQKATVTNKTKLSDAAYSIRLKSENISEAEFVPGYFVRLAVGIDKDEVSLKDKIRSYSVWSINKTEASVDLAIATHGKGIGTRWVKDCKVGDEIYFKWKKGNFLIDDSADSYLMIGDLSSLSHLYIINRHLSSAKKVEGIIYSSDKTELFPDSDGSSPFEFFELPENPIEELITQVNKIAPMMSGKPTVYIAGDSRVCIALNHYFRKELKWETKQIKTKPFWNPEKKGLE